MIQFILILLLFINYTSANPFICSNIMSSNNIKLRNIGRIDKITFEEEHSDAKKGLLLSPDKKEIISNDPFILFAEDWFKLPNGGFPSHPHAGFQTMTFVLDGACEHKDSD